MLRKNPTSPRELIDDLDLTLRDRRFSEDVKNTAVVAIRFAEVLRNVLDDTQREALEIAKRFWLDGVEDGFNDCVLKFAKIVDTDQKSEHASNTVAKNRIIWSSLNRMTRFDGYAAEFLVLTGEKAGLTVQQMRDVMASVLGCHV